MALPYTFSAGANAVAAEVNDNFLYCKNIYHHGNNVMMGKTGTIWIPVIINNVNDTPDVYLEMWGKPAGTSATVFNHGMLVDHYHYINATQGETNSTWQTANATKNLKVLNIGEANAVGQISGGAVATADAPVVQSLVAYTNVPQAVQIWIDGTEYTATIGNPNGKGSGMYDAGNADWGNSSGVAWDTGVLNLSSLITWTAGLHYIELKETGGEGGTLIYHASVNSGHE